MAGLFTRLETFEELMGCLGEVYVWRCSPALELIETSCPEPNLWHGVFSVSPCAASAREHCAQNALPIVLSDPLNLLWIAAPAHEQGQLQNIFLLGPVFSSDISEKKLEQHMQALGLSLMIKGELVRRCQQLPVVGPTIFMQFGAMLHFCITGQRITLSDLAVEPVPESVVRQRHQNFVAQENRGSQHFEQLMLRMVEEGNLNYKELLYGTYRIGEPGILCPDDPMRQLKDLMIVSTALCTRAAVRGGLSYESACALSDYYIQAIEAAHTLTELEACNGEMLDNFIHRVHACKQKSRYSKPVQACVDYIDAHVLEKIELSQMAAQTGYAGYYVTALFKNEVGMSANEYIKQKKIEHAKLGLQYTEQDISQIAEQLSFSSTSYFGSVFREATGMTPGEYRKQNKG